MESIWTLLTQLGIASKKGLAAVFGFVSVLINPITPIILTVICVVLLDLWIGVRASISVKRKQAKKAGKAFKFKPVMIKSKGLFKTLTKALDYLLFIIAGYFAQLYIVPEIPFLKLISGAIIGIELWSIGENIRKIHGVNIIEAIKRWFVSKDISDVVAPKDNDKKEV